MTLSQSEIFNQVKAFVVKNRLIPPSELQDAELSLSNVFSPGERTFLVNLAHDLHLTISWDEYDDDDENLVVLRYPSPSESPLGERYSGSHPQDEVEATAAVDGVLKKYDEAKILIGTVGDSFDSQEEFELKQKMEDWKRSYYQVCDPACYLRVLSNNPLRRSWGYHMTTPIRWAHWSSVISRACNG